MEEFQEGIEDERKDDFGGIGEPDGLPDEMETSTFGLTKQELRNRLKHIAGLCYALSCDITNVEIEAEYLREENRYFREKLNAAGVKQIPKPPHSINGIKDRITRMTGKRFERGDHPDSGIKSGGAPKGNQNARKKIKDNGTKEE